MNTDIPRPEHPTPQFQRTGWMNLNGVWDFAFDFGASGLERLAQEKPHYDRQILVPFCPESALSGIRHVDFIPACWYRRTVTLTKQHLHGAVYLHFGAVDYESHVFVNGEAVGTHKGGYTPFTFEISAFLKEGENEILLYAMDDVRSGRQPAGKQSEQYFSYGCFYTRTTGIWQTVWLEFAPKNHIASVRYYPNIADDTLTIHAKLIGEGTLTATASFEGRPCGEASVRAENGSAFVTVKLTERHLWAVGDGRLYDLHLCFGTDEVQSYFGLREVRLDGYRFLINGKSVFQRLVLDQGFCPDGIYTAPTDKALENDILLSLAAGFNGARLHQKVFEPRFLYHCDRHGYIVWGEMPSWGFDISADFAHEAFLPEWAEAMQRDFNHPALIGWCPFNETWDYHGRRQNDHLIKAAYDLAKLYDDTRPCIDTSGNYHVSTDIYDLHDYDQNPQTFREKYDAFGKGEGPFAETFPQRQQYTDGLPFFISEYGGIKWAPQKDREGAEAWGYGDAPKTEREYLERYRDLTTALLSNPRMFGFCYTQLTDVEQECNGIYAYDRSAKTDVTFFHDVNTQRAAIEG